MDGNPLNSSDEVYRKMVESIVSGFHNNNQVNNQTIGKFTIPICKPNEGSTPNNTLSQNIVTHQIADMNNPSIKAQASPTAGNSAAIIGPIVNLNIPDYGMIQGNLVKLNNGKFILSSTTKDNKTINISLNPNMLTQMSNATIRPLVPTSFNDNPNSIGNVAPIRSVVPNNMVNYSTQQGPVRENMAVRVTNQNNISSNMNSNFPQSVNRPQNFANSTLNFASCLNTNNNTMMMQQQKNCSELSQMRFMPDSTSVFPMNAKAENSTSNCATSSSGQARTQSQTKAVNDLPSLVPVSGCISISNHANASTFYNPMKQKMDASLFVKPSTPFADEAPQFMMQKQSQQTVNKPKPKSAFELFQMDVHKNYIAKNKKEPAPEFSYIVEQMWDALPSDQKAMYEKKLSNQFSADTYEAGYMSKVKSAKRKTKNSSKNESFDDFAVIQNKKSSNSSVINNMNERIVKPEQKYVSTSTSVAPKPEKKPSSSFTSQLFENVSKNKNNLSNSSNASMATSVVCLNSGCKETPKFSRERGGTVYCSNECLISHCRYAFEKMFHSPQVQILS